MSVNSYGNLSEIGPAAGGLGEHGWCSWALRLLSAVALCCWCGRGLCGRHLNLCGRQVPDEHMLGQVGPARLVIAGGLRMATMELVAGCGVVCLSTSGLKLWHVSGAWVSFRRCWNMSCCGAGAGCQLKSCDKCGAKRRGIARWGLQQLQILGWEGELGLGLQLAMLLSSDAPQPHLDLCLAWLLGLRGSWQ